MNQGKSSLFSDVAKLQESDSPEMRAQITDKISSLYQHGVFAANERKIAEEVLSLLSKDSEKAIRKILAQNLKDSDIIPHELALRLAKDIEEISVPMLEYSPVLKESDLLDIVHSTLHANAVAAIARRKDVSDIIANAIVDRAYENAIHDLVGNSNIKLTDTLMTRVANEYGNSGSIMTSLVERGKLSSATIEKILAKVSDELRDTLIKKYNIDTKLAHKVIADTHEKAILHTFSGSDSNKQISELVEHLSAENKLTPSLVMHALCKGNIAFFEVALAKIAKMPPAEVHNTLFGLDNEDVLDLYTKAELPDGAFEAVFIILSYAVQDTASGKFSRTNFASRTSERIISAGQDSSVPMMQNMLAMISSKSSLFDE